MLCEVAKIENGGRENIHRKGRVDEILLYKYILTHTNKNKTWRTATHTELSCENSVL